MPTETLRLSEGDDVDFVDGYGRHHRGVITYAPNPCFPTDYVGVDLGGTLAFRVMWVTRLPPPPDGTCRCAVAGPSRDCRVHGDGN